MTVLLDHGFSSEGLSELDGGEDGIEDLVEEGRQGSVSLQQRHRGRRFWPYRIVQTSCPVELQKHN